MLQRIMILGIFTVLGLLLNACTPTYHAPQKFVGLTDTALSLSQAVKLSSQHLFNKVNEDTNDRYLLGRALIVISPYLDGYDYKEMEVSAQISSIIKQTIKRDFRESLQFVARGGRNVEGHYLVGGKVYIAMHPVTHKKQYRLRSRVTEMATGRVVATNNIWIKSQDINVKSKPVYLHQAISLSNKTLLAHIRKDRMFKNRFTPATVQLKPFTDGVSKKGIKANREIARSLKRITRVSYKPVILKITKNKGHYVISGKIMAKRNPKTKKITYLYHSEALDIRSGRMVSSNNIWIKDDKGVEHKSKPQPFRQSITNASHRSLGGIYKNRVYQSAHKVPTVIMKPLIDAYRKKEVIASQSLMKTLMHTANRSYKKKLQVVSGKKLSDVDYYVEGKVFNRNPNVTKIVLRTKDRRTNKLVSQSELLIKKKKLIYNGAPTVFRSALQQSVEHLLGRIYHHRLFNDGKGKANIVINPFVDIQSLDEVDASRIISSQFINTAKASARVSVKLLSRQSLKGSHYVIQGYIALAPYKATGKKHYKIISVVKEIATGNTIARADAWISDKNIAYRRTPEYKDRPIYPSSSFGRSIYRIKMLMQKKSSAALIRELKIYAALNDAGKLYASKQYQKALNIYQSVLANAQGQQLRIYAGLYLSNLRLGRVIRAEKAFKELIKWSVKSGNKLSMKFLFAVNSIDFSGNAFIKRQYQLWLKNIGQYLEKNRQCFTVVGHSSHTGSASYNKQLSKKRAQSIKELLKPYMPRKPQRLNAIGKGFSENISSLGTDDYRDAIDRRVEFVKGGC